MTPQTWHYVRKGRSPVNGGPSWAFTSDDGLEIAVPWNWRNLRTVGEAESFLNTYVRMLEDRPAILHEVNRHPDPRITWHPAEGPQNEPEEPEHKLTVL